FRPLAADTGWLAGNLALVQSGWPVPLQSHWPECHTLAPHAPQSADANGRVVPLGCACITPPDIRHEQSHTARPPSRPATRPSPGHAGIAPVAPRPHTALLLSL